MVSSSSTPSPMSTLQASTSTFVATKTTSEESLTNQSPSVVLTTNHSAKDSNDSDVSVDDIESYTGEVGKSATETDTGTDEVFKNPCTFAFN